MSTTGKYGEGWYRTKLGILAGRAKRSRLSRRRRRRRRIRRIRLRRTGLVVHLFRDYKRPQVARYKLDVVGGSGSWRL